MQMKKGASENCTNRCAFWDVRFGVPSELSKGEIGVKVASEGNADEKGASENGNAAVGQL